MGNTTTTTTATTAAATSTPATSTPATSTPAAVKTKVTPVPRKRTPRAAAAKPAAAPAAAEAVAPVEAEVAKASPAVAKHKLVRDSFTFPDNEYAEIESLKRKGLALGHHAKKSEVLRAGLAALVALSDEALVAALKAVPPLKTGRPKSGKKR